MNTAHTQSYDSEYKLRSVNIEALINSYEATLDRLAEIAAVTPGEHAGQEVIDREEAILVLKNELSIQQAINMRANSIADIIGKLNLWRIDAIGRDGDADTLSDQLVASVLEDLRRIASL